MPTCTFRFSDPPDRLLEHLKVALVAQGGNPPVFVRPADNGGFEFTGGGESEFVLRSRACQALADVWPEWHDRALR
jgi:hypothetical protein